MGRGQSSGQLSNAGEVITGRDIMDPNFAMRLPQRPWWEAMSDAELAMQLLLDPDSEVVAYKNNPLFWKSFYKGFPGEQFNLATYAASHSFEEDAATIPLAMTSKHTWLHQQADGIEVIGTAHAGIALVHDQVVIRRGGKPRMPLVQYVGFIAHGRDWPGTGWAMEALSAVTFSKSVNDAMKQANLDLMMTMLGKRENVSFGDVQTLTRKQMFENFEYNEDWNDGPR